MTNNELNKEKSAMYTRIEEINKVEGFDPTPFAVDYTDLATGEVRKRLPVMIQIAWFRMKYPTGKVTVQVTPVSGCFVATARIYPDYKDTAENFLAEATASRSYCSEKPSVSPREWAQTAAIGLALRNAGFGLQFALAGEDFADVAPEEETRQERGMQSTEQTDSSEIQTKEPTEELQRELTKEEKLTLAMQTPCPIMKFAGKSLGDVLSLDPSALKWLATKFQGEEQIKEAAKIICDYALEQASA